MIAFVNDRFIEEEKATIQVGDLSIQRGYAAFDFFRTVNKKPLFLNDHLDRFYDSASQLHIEPLHSKEELITIIQKLIHVNNIDTSGIRMILTGGYSDDGYSTANANLILTQKKIYLPTTEKFEAGVRIISYEYCRDLPKIKSTNYLMGVWLQQKLKENNADDVLYFKNGVISEFPRSNIFIITKEKKIVTPANDILHGITRKKLLDMLLANHTVEIRDISMDELKNADEIFMTSTTKRLLPVCKIDAIEIGNGKAGTVTTALCNEFMMMEENWLLEN